jgi:hypothetical protein
MFDDPWDADHDEYDDDGVRDGILTAHIGLSVYPQIIPDEEAFDAFRYGVKAFFSANPQAHAYLDTAVIIPPGAIIGVYFDSKEHRDAAMASARERWPEPDFKVDLIEED